MGCNTSQETAAVTQATDKNNDGGGGGGGGDDTSANNKKNATESSAAGGGDGCGGGGGAGSGDDHQQDNKTNVEMENKSKSSLPLATPESSATAASSEHIPADVVSNSDDGDGGGGNGGGNNDGINNVDDSLMLNGELMGKDEEDAALKIQAVFRGHKVRATMKQGDSSANATNTGAATVTKSAGGGGGNAAETKNNAATVAAIAAAADPTKEELEAEFRLDDKELCDAATRIQATFRGHLARKLATNEGGEDLLKDDKDLADITKKVAEELDIDMNDPELHKAATKIQASFRGHKARREGDGDAPTTEAAK